MTFTQTREEYFSTFQVLELDFLQEIVEIQRDISNEADKYKGTYLEDFDFEYDCEFPEIEYSDYGADLRGARV